MMRTLFLLFVVSSFVMAAQTQADSTLFLDHPYREPQEKPCSGKLAGKHYLSKKKAFRVYSDSARALGQDRALQSQGCYVLRFVTRSRFAETATGFSHSGPRTFITNVNWSYKKLKRCRRQRVSRFHTFMHAASYGGRYIVAEGPKTYIHEGDMTSYGHRILYYYEKIQGTTSSTQTTH